MLVNLSLSAPDFFFFHPICIQFPDTIQTFIMLFSSLTALILPLSALAAPTLVRRDANPEALDRLETAMRSVVTNFRLAVNIGPQRIDLLNDLKRLGTNINLIPISEAMIRVVKSVNEGNNPAIEEYVDTSH